jgi:hypothetical protein
MAYMQKPGRAPLENKNFEALTNGTSLKNDNDKKDPKTGKKKTVKSYNVKTGKESLKKVTAKSGDAELSKELGGTLTFESADQSKKSLTKKKSDPKTGGGVNKSTTATRATYGALPKGFKGRAKDKNNKIVDFSTSNNDSRRKEKFRLY